jgi:UDP-N-acetylmuramoyl-tripeptide--D-alanyl-D-alanine ligase
LVSQEQNITFYFIGIDFYANKVKQSNCHFFEDFEALSLHLQHQKLQNATILIKGSRGMALERTLDYL